MKRKPQNPSGFKDVLPAQAFQREEIIEKIRNVYRRFGFMPLETPSIEFVDTLIGDVSDFNLFYVDASKERKGGDDDKKQLGLRFDLTVPLARVVAQYGELPKPLKRYQLGNVFRGERPQKGRYRQFAQFDADVVGADTLLADTEMILMIRSVMQELGLKDFVVRVNTRTLLNALPEYADFDEKLLRDVLIILDKAEKITKEEMTKELQGVGVSDDGIEKLIAFSALRGKPDDVLEEIKKLFEGVSSAEKGTEELTFIAKGLETLTNGKYESITFDMSIVRGLAYYTGPIFETMLLDLPSFGSVCSGGRYDNLVEQFGARPVPAVGMSVGVDRLYAALEELGMVTETTTLEKSFLVFPMTADVSEYALSVAERLRLNGKVAEVYAGKEQNLGKIFGYAEGRGFAHVVIVGSDEFAKQTVQIKNIIERTQEEISFTEL